MLVDIASELPELVLEITSQLAMVGTLASLQFCCKTLHRTVRQYLGTAAAKVVFYSCRVVVVYPDEPMSGYVVWVHLRRFRQPDWWNIEDGFHEHSYFESISHLERMASIRRICHQVLANAYGSGFSFSPACVELGNEDIPRLTQPGSLIPAAMAAGLEWTPREWDAGLDGNPQRLGWLMGRDYGQNRPERPSLLRSENSLVATCCLEEVYRTGNQTRQRAHFPLNLPVHSMYPRLKQKKYGIVVLLKLHEVNMPVCSRPDCAGECVCVKLCQDDVHVCGPECADKCVCHPPPARDVQTSVWPPPKGPTYRGVCLGLQDMTRRDIDDCVNNLYLGALKHDGWYSIGSASSIRANDSNFNVV